MAAATKNPFALRAAAVLRASFVVAALAACGCEHPVPLSAFARAELHVFSWATLEDGADGPVHIDLWLRATSGCPTLASGTYPLLDGEPLSVVSWGENNNTFLAGGCASASFTTMRPASSLGPLHDTRFEMSDETHRIVVVVHGLLAHRTLTPRQARQPLTPGQTLVFDWSPADDAFDLEPQIAFNPMVNEYYEPEVQRMGTVIQLTVPDDIPDGPTHLQLSFFPSSPVTECTGVTTCSDGVAWNEGVSTVIAR